MEVEEGEKEELKRKIGSKESIHWKINRKMRRKGGKDVNGRNEKGRDKDR